MLSATTQRTFTFHNASSTNVLSDDEQWGLNTIHYSLWNSRSSTARL